MEQQCNKIGFSFQTEKELILNDEKDFISYYEKIVPSDITNIIVANLYKRVVCIAGDKCSIRYLFDRKDKDTDNQSIGQKAFDGIYNGRGKDVYEAVCHYLIPYIDEGKIPLPYTGSNIIKKTDTVTYDKDNNYLLFSNPYVLGIIVSTVFEQTKHLHCIKHLEISMAEYGLHKISNIYKENTRDMLFLDENIFPTNLVMMIKESDHIALDCLEELSNTLDFYVKERREELSKLYDYSAMRRGVLHPDNKEIIGNKCCIICKREDQMLYTYTCNCPIQICMRCQVEKMLKYERKCPLCDIVIDCIRKRNYEPL